MLGTKPENTASTPTHPTLLRLLRHSRDPVRPTPCLTTCNVFFGLFPFFCAPVCYKALSLPQTLHPPTPVRTTAAVWRHRHGTCHMRERCVRMSLRVRVGVCVHPLRKLRAARPPCRGSRHPSNLPPLPPLIHPLFAPPSLNETELQRRPSGATGKQHHHPPPAMAWW